MFAAEQCSTDNIGSTTLNEVFVKTQGGSSQLRAYLEVKLLDATAIDKYESWFVKICTTSSCQTFSLADSENDNLPWAYFDKDSRDINGVSLNINLIDFASGFDLSLLDENGDFIDYISVNNVDRQNFETFCTYNDLAYVFPIPTTSNGTKLLHRTPDGFGSWTALSANNDESPGDGNTPPTNHAYIVVSDDTVMQGETENFVISIENSSGSPAYSGEDIELYYRTVDNTATSPEHYNGVILRTLEIPAGFNNATIAIDTLFIGDQITRDFELVIRPQDIDDLDDFTIRDDTGVGTITPAPSSLLTYYQMDELAWNGTGGEVLNELGTLHGTAFNGLNTDRVNPARAGNPGTCGYGEFDGLDDYVQIDDDDTLDIANELTITTWIYPTALPALPNSDLMTVLSKDENYEFHVTPSGEINWWWNDANGVIREINSDTAVTLNAWNHIAITYKDGEQIIYINGVNRGQASYSGALLTNNDPLQFGQDQFHPGRFFQGAIDEVKIYTRALAAVAIDAIYQEVHPCDSFIDHFEINAKNAQGLTCEPDLISIKACSDSSCSILNHDAVDVVFSVSDSNGMVLNQNVTVVGGEVDVSYIYTKAEIVSLSLDQTYECINGSPADCNVTFANAGFRFIGSAGTSLPVQLSGKPSNIGYNADTLKIEAVQTDQVTGACAPLLVTGSVIDMAASYQAPTTGTAKVNISGTDIGTANNGTAFNSLPFTDVTLDFGNDTQHSADFIFTYTDAGSVVLNARYELPDDDGNPSGNYITGSSNPFVVRPFAFGIFVDKNLPLTDPDYKVNPAATSGLAPNNLIFTVAGDDIRISTRAVAWKTGDDVNANGLADQGEDLSTNTTTANFTNLSLTSLTHALVEPVAGVDGTLTIVSGGDFSGGVKTDTGNYDEVGIISLTATKNDYLAAGIHIEGGVPYVGRFTPAHFTITSIVDGILTGACSAADNTDIPFVYSGQMLSDSLTIGAIGYLNTPSLVIEARNKADVLTQNYINDFNKLSLASFNRLTLPSSTVLAPDTDATQVGKDLTNLVRLTANLNAANIADAAGVITYSYDDNDHYVYLHEENSEINEFTSDIDLSMVSIIDSDLIETLDYDIDPANGLIVTLNPSGKLIRFGRAQLQNSYGPETSNLPQPLSVNYFKDGQYMVADNDQCTPYNATNMTVAYMPAPDNTLNPALTPPIAADGKFIDEVGITRAIELTSPGTGNTGSICVSYATLPWLQYKWATDVTNLQCPFSAADVDSLYNDNPFGIATFGIYRGNDRIIYQREIEKTN